MKMIFGVVLTIVSLFTLSSSYAATSPVGTWTTIDDVTGKPKAIVQLWQTADNQLYGKILKVFPRPGIDANGVCSKCEGKTHNMRLNGMIFLQSLKQSKDNQVLWSGGKILDPKNGKTYHCNLQVADQGKKLNVRGYLGLPLFGRTQTWIRA